MRTWLAYLAGCVAGAAVVVALLMLEEHWEEQERARATQQLWDEPGGGW
ncbi:MAG TPA: hypothetical protein VIM25_04365 [Candidatus Limnocylindrales bacterium]|jgi:hypothetical protein